MAAHGFTILTQVVPRLSLALPSQDKEEIEDVMDYFQRALDAPGMGTVPYTFWSDMNNSESIDDAYQSSVRALENQCARMQELCYPATLEEWEKAELEEMLEDDTPATSSFSCGRCGEALNPIAAMMGDVCGSCVRKAHREVIGGQCDH